MAFANLFWQHPTGDRVMVPCSHLGVVQSGTTSISAPTNIEIIKQHDHDTVTDVFGVSHDVPCLHLDAKITSAPMSIPSYEVRPQHPGGDDSPVSAPCVHPLAPAHVDTARHIIFFTDDKKYQGVATDLIDRLLTRLHVRTMGGTSRPLLFFFREAVNGNPNDATDPFWSHYDSSLHAIQITRNSAVVNYDNVRSTLAHELGHALVGQSCVRIPNEGDPHSMKSPSHPGEAMSEGWADFVQIAVSRDDRSAPGPAFDYEKRDMSVPKTNDIEYNILCLLWDLYDVFTKGPQGFGIMDDDPASSLKTAFSFEDLFGVFSPSLETLPAGPVIWDIDNYLSRLKATYPDRAAVVDSVRALHIA
jgi:hypothetical protein